MIRRPHDDQNDQTMNEVIFNVLDVVLTSDSSWTYRLVKIPLIFVGGPKRRTTP